MTFMVGFQGTRVLRTTARSTCLGYAKGLTLDTVEMFDPSSGKWALKTVMPEAWADMSTGSVKLKLEAQIRTHNQNTSQIQHKQY